MDNQVHRTVDVQASAHVGLAELEARHRPQAADAAAGTGQKVVHTDHRCPGGKQTAAHVCAEEPGASGDDGTLRLRPAGR